MRKCKEKTKSPSFTSAEPLGGLVATPTSTKTARSKVGMATTSHKTQTTFIRITNAALKRMEQGMRSRKKRIFHASRVRGGRKVLLCSSLSGYIALDEDVTCKQCLKALGHEPEAAEKYSRKNFLLGQVLS